MKMHKPTIFRLTAATVLLAGAMPVLSAAESADEELVLDAVVVQGTGYRTTGTQSELKPMEAPMGYEIYDHELLVARQEKWPRLIGQKVSRFK